MKIIIIIFQILLISSISFSQRGNLQVSYMRDMKFQQIIPGVQKIISETSQDAGKFIITGDGTHMMVSVTFNLPRNVTNGASNLPIRYTAMQSSNSNDIRPGTPFDPYAGTTLIFDDKVRNYFIKIGGKINPVKKQTAGNYTAPVIMILTVLSN